MSFKSLFLPVGLFIAIAFGLVFPGPGATLGARSLLGLDASRWLVVCVFLVAGYRMRASHIDFTPAFGLVALAAVVVNLLGGPLLALLAGWIWRAEPNFLTGLVVMSAVPTTLSTAMVITRNSGGNGVWALVLTLILTLAGVVLLPFTLSAALGVGTPINVPALPLLVSICTVVLLPLAAGQVIRWVARGWDHALLDYTPSLCIIVTVLVAVSRNAAMLRAIPPLHVLMFASACLFVHLGLMALAWLAQELLKLRRAEALALVLTGSQKTLPLALTVLLGLSAQGLNGGILGVGTVVCVVFHYSQVLLDSMLASWIIRIHPRP